MWMIVKVMKTSNNAKSRVIQSAYLDHTRFSIITAYCYYRDAENKMFCESVTISSELSDYFIAAVVTRIPTVINHLRE